MAGWHPQRLGAMLRQRRKSFRWSAHQLALQAGVDPGTVLRLEKGRIANPNTGTLQAIADALGLPVADLFRAGSADTPGTQLPSLTPYLRTKYPHLSNREVSEIADFFDYIQSRYGDHRPARGDDER